jgi:nucleoside-triphosphatase THEP1
MKLVITGPKGSGKSRLTDSIIGAYRGAVEGFRTARGSETCTITDIRTKRSGIIARGRIEQWTGDPSGFLEVGIPSLRHAVEQADLIVMDELGTFEDCAPEFQALVLRALDSDKDVLVTTRDESTPFLESVRTHESVHGDRDVIHLKKRGKDRIASRIEEWLKRH